MNDEQNSALKILVELVDQVTEPIRTIQENLESFESSIWEVGKAMGSAFVGFEALDHLMEPAAKYEEYQAQLKMASGLGAEGLKELKEQAEALSETYQPSLEDVTQAQTELYKVFHDLNTVKAASAQADILATALNINAADAAKILATAYEGMPHAGQSVNQFMGTMADKLTVLNTKFRANSGSIAMMSRDLARTSLMAKAYGIDLDTTLSIMGTVNNLGLAGQRGSGMFTQEMLNEGIKTLHKYGLVVEYAHTKHLAFIDTLKKIAALSPQMKQALMQKLPESAQGLVQLADHWQDIVSGKGLFDNAHGAAIKDAKIQMETLNSVLTTLKNTMDNIADLWGTLALPTFKQMAEWAKKAQSVFEGFSKSHPAIAKLIMDTAAWSAGLVFLVGSIAAVIKIVGVLRNVLLLVDPILPIFTVLSTTIEGIGVWFTSAASAAEVFGVVLASINPLGWAALAVAAAVLIYEHWAKVKQIFEEVAGAAEKMFHAFEHSTIMEKIGTLIHLGSGDVAGAALTVNHAQLAGAGAISSSSAQHIHYSPNINVNVAAGVDQAQAAKEFNSILRGNAADFAKDMAEQQRRQSRLTFQDTTNPQYTGW